MFLVVFSYLAMSLYHLAPFPLLKYPLYIWQSKLIFWDLLGRMLISELSDFIDLIFLLYILRVERCNSLRICL